MSPYTWHHRKEWNKCSYNISMSLKLSVKLNSWKILLVSVTHCCLQTSRCSCCGRNTLFGIGALKIPRLKLWVSWHDGSRWFHPPSQPMSFFLLSNAVSNRCKDVFLVVLRCCIMDVSGIMRFSNISSNLICSDVVIEDSKRFFQSTQLAGRIAWGEWHKGFVAF